MDFALYLMFGFVVGFIGVSIWSSSRKLEMEIGVLKKIVDNTIYVTVEKHIFDLGNVFLMFNLLDDKFLLQATTPAALVKAAKVKFPNKLILITGNDEICGMPEFNEVTPDHVPTVVQ